MKLRYMIISINLLIAITLWATPGPGQSVNYKSQSLYLYLFSKNIFWPATCNNKDFVIGVYGNSPIYNDLQTMASIKKAGNGQKIVIKKFETLDEISDDIMIVYITSAKSRDLTKIVEKIGKRPTLIVAERDGLAKKGAGINFIVMENNSLKFEVNEQKILNQNLKISPDLLAQGYKVK